jgi:hypothetical protein
MKEDAFMAFIEDKTIDLDALKITPVRWWLLPEQRRCYPRLHRMGIDVLSIAPSSAEPEQQFSGARRTQSWDKLRLSPGNLQRLECMGNWFARKLTSSEELLVSESPVRIASLSPTCHIEAGRGWREAGRRVEEYKKRAE